MVPSLKKNGAVIAGPCAGVFEGFDCTPLWLLPYPFNEMNVRSSTLRVGQICTFAVLIVYVECVFVKLWSFVFEERLPNHGIMVEYEHGVCELECAC